PASLVARQASSCVPAARSALNTNSRQAYLPRSGPTNSAFCQSLPPLTETSMDLAAVIPPMAMTLICTRPAGTVCSGSDGKLIQDLTGSSQMDSSLGLGFSPTAVQR